jgi:dynein regulatory complex protein 1
MDADIVQGVDCVKGHEQVLDSQGLIEKQKRETWYAVSKIRTDADHSEDNRRIVEDRLTSDRYQSIQNEIVASTKQIEAAEFKWVDLLKIEQCDELAARMEEHKAECEDFLMKKQQLIDEFMTELKDKDGFYVKALRRMQEDIDRLLDMMRNQFYSLRKDYAQHLETIEEAFITEREDLLKANQDEIDQLFERHKEMESRFSEQRQMLEDKYADEIEQMRQDEASEFQKHKNRLETDLQIVQKYLEEMKAIYQLNADKLEYNYKVLDEKVKENEASKSLLTKRINRLVIKLSDYKNLFFEEERKLTELNIKLTAEFKQKTKAFNELQRKFRHFEKADTTRFNEIWEMNEAEVRELAAKVIKCDRTIYMQQLGLPWSPPQDIPLDAIPGSLSESYSRQASVEEGGSERASKSLPMDRVRQVLTLLAEECSFLLEDKVIDQCIGKTPNEQLTLKIDSVRRSLGVETMADIELLVNLFYDHSANSDHDEFYDLEGDEDSRDPDALEIEPDEIIGILEEFMNIKAERALSAASPDASALSAKSIQEAEISKHEKVLKEKQFWKSLSQALPERHLRTWRAVGKAFTQYHGLLKERQDLIEETGVLHQQNMELKSLLNQYLQAPVNDELRIPPTQMIRFEEDED